MKTSFIDSNALLQKVLPEIKTRRIAFDLEFDNNLHHYGFHLCLIQIYNGKETFLIDPKATDITMLFPVFESPSIQKVVFAGGEDLRLLHYLGCRPKNIYDLMHAYRLLNYEPASLSAILDITLGVETSKDKQTSDWCARPLKQSQLRYARQDVIHLLDLQDFFEREARKKGLDMWIAEENAALDDLRYEAEGIFNTIPEKVKRRMTEYEWYIYRQLWELREKIARQYDRPPYQVIENKLLENLATDRSLINRWLNMRGIHRRIKNKGFEDKLLRLMAKWEREARQQKLSKVKKAIPPLDREEHQKRKEERIRREKIKEEIYKPLQKKIAEKLGDHAVNFVLSNKQIDHILAGGEVLNYKKELFRRYGKG